MNRFWLFPVLLGLVGILLPPLVLCEGFLPLFIANVDLLFSGPGYSIWYVVVNFWFQLVDSVKEAAPYGALGGGLLGVGLAAFDWWRNGRRDRTGIYATAGLLPNLWWCGIYAGGLALVNSLIFSLFVRLVSFKLFPALRPGDFIEDVPVGLAALLNLCAVLWGGIRCITSEDVLSPCVLRSQFKRSARSMH